jgi:iron(III) transport system substrate-binding protein
MFKNLLLTLLVTSFVYANTQEVNIYSHRHYDTDKQLFKAFEQQTGIKVNIVTAKADELINKIEKEGKNSPADILITSDAGRLHLAQEAGLLQTVDSKILNEIIPENLRQKDGYWFALTKRARVIVYNKDKIKPEELSTYESLTSENFHKKVLVRQSDNIYNQSLLASMIANYGEEKAKAWAKGIVNNFAREPKGSDRDQMKAVAAGLGDVAIVNTYYLGKLLNSNKVSEVAVGKKMGIVFPNQNSNGTHINISGAGVIKYSKNKQNAIKLLEFLVSPQAQKLFAEANYEYPVNANVQPSLLIQSWGKFKEDTLPLEELGKNNAKAVKIFNEVGWK